MVRLLSHAHAAMAAEHIEHENVVVTVAIDVGKIDAHGKKSQLAKRQARQRAKSAFALVDPDAVGRVKIIADVEIGKPIAVDIAEHHREPPIKRRLL